MKSLVIAGRFDMRNQLYLFVIFLLICKLVYIMSWRGKAAQIRVLNRYRSIQSTIKSTDNTDTNKSCRRDIPIDYITFVSSNAVKRLEVTTLLADQIPYPIRFDASLDFEEPQATPIEISQSKCRQAIKRIPGACLVEDTSLCFNALNGLPGPYIKWFVESLGNEGLSKLLYGFDDKSAYAQCVVSFSPGYPLRASVDGQCTT